MTLQEEAIDKVQNDHSYHIIDARVRTYMGQKYLTVSTDTIINEVPEISEIATQLHDTTSEGSGVVVMDKAKYTHLLSAASNTSKFVRINDEPLKSCGRPPK